MPFYEREDKILSMLAQKNEYSVTELAEKLYISVPTMRRDLIKLEKKGKVIRTHGGVTIIKKSADTKIPFLLREKEQDGAKAAIAEIAADCISDGDTIMLDGTTSAYHIISHLTNFKNLIVITSGAKASFALGQLGINNISTGGRMLNMGFSYVGDDACRCIERYNADILFFSCRGLSEDGWLSDNSIEENIVRRAMMHRAKKKILLCDSSKIGKTCLNNLCHISEIDEIICETELPNNIKYLLK